MEAEAAKYLAAAHGLAPLVEASRDRFDLDRRLPVALVDAMGKAGLFGLWLPRALRGPELPPLSLLTITEELARQDGSVGWCTVIPAGYSLLAGAMEAAAAGTVFGSGRGVLAGSLNPTGKAVSVPGGYRVTGRWSYGSFIDYSDWVLGNCITEDQSGSLQAEDGGPAFRLCLFPREAVEVIDVWHVGGLRATGSNDYRVADLFVPEALSIPMPGFNPPPRQPGALFTIPLPSTFVSCIATVALGIGRAAIAVRENRFVAQSIGISPFYLGLVTFVLAAAIAGLAGGFYANYVSFVGPEVFGFSFTILRISTLVTAVGCVLIFVRLSSRSPSWICTEAGSNSPSPQG